MKNFKVMLALVAILAMAGTACAEITVSIEQTGTVTGTTGDLDVFMVKVGGALGFFNVSITDGAGVAVPLCHQVSPKSGMGGNTADPTPFESDILTYLGGADPLNSLLADTHLMIDPGAINATPGANFYDETNDKTNPAGIDDGYGAYFHYGLGTSDMDEVEGFTIANELALGSDFMQVVLPAGTDLTAVYLEARLDGGGETLYVNTPFIPEPGTAVMLIVGALCLFGIRIRK